MIVKLDKQQQPIARRQLLCDPVWVICNDTLRDLQRNGITQLAPVEVFLTAQEFSRIVLSLPNVDEGLVYEMDDLEDEVGIDDATTIMLVATLQMQALSKQCVGIDIHKINLRIIERLSDRELFMQLIDKFTYKEESNWIEGKRTDLLNYELKEIELEEGGIQEKIRVVSEITDAALNLSNEEVRGVLVSLVSINKKYDHVFDEQISKLLDKLGITQSEVHNHFEKDSHCNVFNGPTSGQF